MNIGALIATLGVDAAGLRQAQREMEKFERKSVSSMKRINQSLEETGAEMKKFGRQMSMAVTAPILLAGGAAFKMYRDFESSMTKIIGLVGVARDVVQGWSEDILRLAPTLGKSPKELADALFFITSAGIRGAEAMEVLIMSAKASAAGLGETKIVADLVTSAMNAYGIEVLSASQATDVLVAAVREGKAQADALASSMGMVLPIAAAMQVSFDQVGGAIAAMTRTGTSAATASMQLRQMLNSLLKPTQQAEMAMWNMGTSSAKLRKTIREDGLLKALMEIKSLTERYGETVMAKVFPNIRALSGVLDIMGSNLEDNIKIFKELENALGSSERAFKEAAQTAEFKWNQAMVSVKTTLTTMGKTIAEMLIPLLERFTERMQKITLWFDHLSDRQKRLIIQIAALVAVIGPLALVLGFLVGNVLPGLIIVVVAAANAFKLLSVAMMANPITAIIGGIVAFASFLLLFTKRTNEATTSQRALNKTLEDFNTIMEEGQRIKEGTDSIKDRMKVIDTLNKRQVSDLLDRVKQQIQIEEDFTAQLKEQQKKRLLEEEEASKLEDAVERSNWLREQSAWKQQWISQESANTARLQQLKEHLIDVERTLKTFKGGATFRDLIMKTLDTQLTFIESMGTALGDAFDTSGAKVEAYMTALTELIKNGVDPLDAAVQRLAAHINDLNNAITTIKPVSITQDVQTSGMVPQTDQLVMTEGLKQQYQDQIDLTKELMEGQTKYIQLVGVLGSAFQGMSNSISDALNNTSNILQAFGEFFKDWIKGMLIRLIAVTLAALAFAVVLSAIGAGGGAVAKFLDIKNLGFKDFFKSGFKGMLGVPGLAEGGIVPSGFSNDSFPAMLSSGEAVIPLDRFSGMFKDAFKEGILLYAEIENDKITLSNQRGGTFRNRIT